MGLTAGADKESAAATVQDRGASSTRHRAGRRAVALEHAMTSQSPVDATDGIRPATQRRPDPPARPSRRKPTTSIGAIGVLGILLGLVLIACSGGAAPDDVATLVDPSASPDASPSASLDPEAAMDAFAQCMRDHGVDIQISSAGGEAGKGPTTATSSARPISGTDKGEDAFTAASKGCAPLLPKGGVNGPGGQPDPEMEQKLLDFSRCMREHGVDMPDPQFENGGANVIIGGPDGPDIDPSSQAFKDAQKACESLLPGKLGTTGDTGPVTQGSKP
jgi:hypothetical protein